MNDSLWVKYIHIIHMYNGHLLRSSGNYNLNLLISFVCLLMHIDIMNYRDFFSSVKNGKGGSHGI